MGFSRQEYWRVCHSLLQWTTFCQTSSPWPAWLGWPRIAWHSFIKLDKAVVRVIRLASLLWLWFQCVCPLMPLATPTILLGFLLPWSWGISSRLLQQSAAAAPYLGRGVFPHGRPSWPWTWSSSSRPSCTHAAADPWTWGCSSQEQHNRRLYTWTSPDGQHWNQIDYILCSKKVGKLYTVSKNKIGSWLWLRSWSPYCQIQA